MTGKVAFEDADGETTTINTDDDDDLVNIHINEDKNAVVIKYEDRREIVPMCRVYRVIEYNRRP